MMPKAVDPKTTSRAAAFDMIWGRYRKGLFQTTLTTSFQFHHTQMDGAHAGRFLQRLQENIANI